MNDWIEKLIGLVFAFFIFCAACAFAAVAISVLVEGLTNCR